MSCKCKECSRLALRTCRAFQIVESEKETLKFWEDNDCFNALKKQNENGPKFRFIDGPITANGALFDIDTFSKRVKSVCRVVF